MKYDVFISYSRRDQSIAEQICAAFDRVGIVYFIDRQGMGGARNVLGPLGEAILDSKMVLLLGSNNAYMSKYVDMEIEFAVEEKARTELLPYLIDDTEMPVKLRMCFAGANRRNIKDHPIDTIFVEDMLRMLGREVRKATLGPQQPVERPSKDKPASKLNDAPKGRDVSKGKDTPKDKGTPKERPVTTPAVDTSTNDDAHLQELIARKKAGKVSLYDVELISYNAPLKLVAVKELKEKCDLGLKEAKDLVDNVPITVKSGVSYSDAANLQRRLEEGGILKVRLVGTTKQRENRYKVVLHDVGPRKLQAVKYLVERFDGRYGIASAKQMIDYYLPAAVVDNCSESEARAIVKEFADMGATAEMKLIK